MHLHESELILNEDGSIYHLNLKPEHVARDIIFVGDQDRVEKITTHFDQIECSIQKREFKTQTGTYKGKRISVISTGIGPDNIDIVLNELDALFNIDLSTRKVKSELTQLNIVRVGTSGALQKDIKVDDFVLSTHGLDLNGMLHFYEQNNLGNQAIEEAFISHTNWTTNKAKPLVISNSISLQNRFKDDTIHLGITATAGGFYGPQGRVLRIPLADQSLNSKIDSFRFNDHRITNLEMETSVIYGMAKLLGHNAVSLSAILANRANGTFSKNPGRTVEDLILFTLNKLIA
jgi:uridine phosphorylase